jgi:hypothetical protein
MGEVIGPMTSSELRDRARQGRISRDALVRKGDDGDWILVDRIKGLFDASGQPVKQASAVGSRAGINGQKRRGAPADDDFEEAIEVEDQRPPWFKKRYLFSTAVVLGVAAYLVTSLMQATREEQVVEQSYFEEPAVFDSLEDQLEWYEVRLRNLSATSQQLNEQFIRQFNVENPALLQSLPAEIEEFRKSLDLPELEFLTRYTQGIRESSSLALLDEYFLLLRQMEHAREGLEELKNNNPSEYKIKMFIDALGRVQQATIANCIAVIKLARNRESLSQPQ